MKKVQQSVYILLMMSIACFVSAEAVKDATLESLMVLSGINSQIQDIPVGVKAGVLASRGGVSSGKDTHFDKAVDQLFNADQIQAEVYREVAKAISEQDAQKLLTWYESNLGNRIARAEEYAATPQAMAEMQATVQVLMSDETRMPIARKLMETGDILDKGLQMQQSMMTAVQVAATKYLKPNDKVALDEISKMIEAQQPRVQQIIEQSILLNIAYTFRDFEIAELESYIETLKKEEMQKFNSGALNGMVIALEKAAKEMASTSVSI